MTSVMAQLLVPFAATLAPQAERGRVVGNVMSGLMLGILLARTFSGLVAQAAGWRTVYVIAAVLMLAQAVLLYVKLPLYRQSAGLPYPKLLASVVRITRDEPVLRRRSLYGMFSFATFSVLWTTLAFLLSGSALQLQRRDHRALRAGRRGRGAGRLRRRPLHGSGLGLLAHRRRLPAHGLRFRPAVVGPVILATSHRRHPDPRRGLAGHPHQQPERDLPAASGGREAGSTPST